MNETNSTVQEFFDRYAEALLARDEQTIADMYAVPSLIVFPGNLIAVSEAAQTGQFFASAWVQYDGIDNIASSVDVITEAPGSVWADVTWSYDGLPRERYCYQLVDTDDGHQIAVLTPMSLPNDPT